MNKIFVGLVAAFAACFLAGTACFAETEPAVPVPSALERTVAADHRILVSDTWGGFHRIVFDFNGRKAWIVEPRTAAAGKPWFWTMQWMGAFRPRTGADDLMKKGYHHVHLEAFSTRANDEGVKAFADYQAYLVGKLGFAPKANLIGMSWGGFFSIRYANAHPENVRRIYLDAPLLSFDKFGQGVGPWKNDAPKDGNWGADPRMPVNMAESVAKAGIPILLLYGGCDSVVPPSLNCEPFAKRFKAAGGAITVDRRDAYAHHPHGVELNETGRIVKFFAD